MKQFLSNAILQRQNNDYTTETLPELHTDSSLLSSDAIQFLRFSLNDFPYPSFILVNILKHEAPYEKVFDDLEYYTIANAVENVSESKEYDKIYCMLANFQLRMEKFERFCVQVLPIVSERVNSGVLSSKFVILALLSRNDKLLQRFLQCEQKLKLIDDHEKYMFNQLTLKNKNCVYEFVTHVDHHKFQQQDHELSQYARAVKLIDLFNVQAAEDIDMNVLLKRVEPLLEEIDDPKNNQLMKLYLLEMRREQLLMKFLNEHSSVNFVNVCHFSRQRKILYELLENVNISFKMYEKLKPLVIAHHEYVDQMLSVHNPNRIVPRKDELEYFSIILCVKIMMDLIYLDESQDEYTEILETSVSHIKEVSKNIKEMTKRLRFCEILFTLLFIRFEDITEGSLPFQPHIYCHDFDTSDNDEHRNVRFSSRVSSTTGFMACESLVRAILNFIKMYLLRIKRSHAFIEETEVNRDRHTKILESTNDALYRLSIITKSVSLHVGANLRSHTTHLDSLLKPHATENGEGISTDEEENGQKKYHVARRRTKRSKRNKLNSESDKTSYSTTNSTTNGSENVLLDMKCSYTSERGRPRKIVNKMLSSPDTLATLCASRGDIIELKNVIKVSRFLNK